MDESVNINEKINKDKQKIIIQNNNFSFIKQSNNHYKISGIIENKNILIKNIINFNFLELICKINNELFEIIELKIDNENEAYLFLLVKPIFKNFGILQRYISLKIIQSQIMDTVIFTCIPYLDNALINKYSNNIIHAPIFKIIVQCNIHNPYKFELNKHIYLEENFIFPSIIEQLMGNIFKKIYKKIVKTVELIK
jgi:hypothetical protein